MTPLVGTALNEKRTEKMAAGNATDRWDLPVRI